ncbi:MAG: hypothetical protein ACJ74R_11345 [Gaiellaceae bacterium]
MDEEPSIQEEREVRAARNQALFRAVNNELASLDQASEPAASVAIACECADARCVEVLHIGRDEYAEVRRNPRHFAVLPGHVYPNIEAVVKSSDTHVVVEKFAEAGEVAENLDPTTETTDV